MIGAVDGKGRALLELEIAVRSSAKSFDHLIETWIDTGFNRDLVVPVRQIEELGLEKSGTVKAVLADGSEVALETYSCYVGWFGNRRQLEVIANEGEYALLGVGLLLGRDLHISYRTRMITID